MDHLTKMDHLTARLNRYSDQQVRMILGEAAEQFLSDRDAGQLCGLADYIENALDLFKADRKG